MRQVVEFQIGHHTDKNVPGWDGCRAVGKWIKRECQLEKSTKCPACGSEAPVVATRKRIDLGVLFNPLKWGTN